MRTEYLPEFLLNQQYFCTCIYTYSFIQHLFVWNVGLFLITEQPRSKNEEWTVKSPTRPTLPSPLFLMDEEMAEHAPNTLQSTYSTPLK